MKKFNDEIMNRKIDGQKKRDREKEIEREIKRTRKG